MSNAKKSSGATKTKKTAKSEIDELAEDVASKLSFRQFSPGTFIAFDGDRLTGVLADIHFHSMPITGKRNKSSNGKAPDYNIYAPSPDGTAVQIGGGWLGNNHEGSFLRLVVRVLPQGSSKPVRWKAYCTPSQDSSRPGVYDVRPLPE